MCHAATTSLKSKLAIFRVNSASITSKYVGETEKILEALFKYANQSAPSMIFIGKNFLFLYLLIKKDWDICTEDRGLTLLII